ncbi:MAG: HAMP domain-containing protein [Actinomycetales bacterium]|nr:HAMP domain-containing protein [Actinomycetales bacterium]
MRLGLRTRVALAFALLSLVVAGTVSATTYAFASWYLIGQRESAALTRAALDSRAVAAYLDAGVSPSDTLGQIPSVGTSQPMILRAGTWYTSAVTVQPDSIPQELLKAADPTGASQRFSVSGDPFYAVAIPVSTSMYVEVFPLRDLDVTLTWGGWILVALTLIAGALGAVIGFSAVRRILGPVRRLGEGAQRIAGGELSTRIDLTGDPDLDPIADSFNDMAQAVQTRIARERRFTGNVSHELRSPLTAVLGTTELLESRRDRLGEREASLIDVLAYQVRRMSQMLLDLLEISRIGNDDPPLFESADVAALCREVAQARGIDPGIVVGDEPTIRTDARRFERIVGNLVDNAQHHGQGVVQVLIQRQPGVVQIMVDDAGPGVDPEIRDRLFEPFSRGDRAKQTAGAGLGLAIALEQAHVLGGDLTITDSPAGGARFVASLPAGEGTT